MISKINTATNAEKNGGCKATPVFFVNNKKKHFMS